MQWSIMRCCRFVGVGSCLEMTAGVFQVFLQWFMFTVILVLYMLYYPQHRKYVELDVDAHDSRPPQHVKTSIRSDEWRLSITLSWVVFIHIVLITFITFSLLITTPLPPSTIGAPLPPHIELWATFLGVASAGLAAIQYAPQIIHTYRMKLVGALSIPMMCIQSPGAVLMILSVALRPGTNWTSWITFAVAGIMQGTLLVMCIVWKFRQHKLKIDDFGQPLSPSSEVDGDDDLRVSVTRTPDDGLLVAQAVEDAVEGSVYEQRMDEETPLLAGKAEEGGWLSWFRRKK